MSAPPGRMRVALLGGALALAVAIVLTLHSSGGPAPPPLPGSGRAARAGDPFAYVPAHEAQFVARATAGCAQVLFTKSPGGVLATAARVAALRPALDAATRGSGVDPGLVEGIVFVESAGRPYVVAGSDPSSAAGVTQILASTGTSLLGMHIDLPASRRLLRAIGSATSPGQVRRLLARLRAADDRFNPTRALAATVRYLRAADQRFHRSDLDVVSYHMGIGNLQHVLGLYDGGQSVPYAQLYFDTAPDRHTEAFRLLSGFGDQSSLYLWRVLGAVDIMRLYRHDRPRLARLSVQETSGASTEYVLHPAGRSESFADPGALSEAYAQRTLIPLPRNAAALGLAVSPQMGTGARGLGVPPALYRGLRPPALDLLVELAARVRSLSGSVTPLRVQSTVLDRRLQAHTGIDDPPAAAGYTFRVARRYGTRGQAVAFQAMLDRLQALNLIAWSRSAGAIEITVSADASQVIAGGV